MRVIIIILIVVANVSFFYGQDAPVTTATTINNPAPGSINVPITVTDFNNIGAISLSLDYDHSVMNFVQGTPNPAIPGWFIITDNDLGDGFHRIMMGWYGSGFSLPDSSSIMDIEFTYISGTTSLAWYDNGGSCEYADDNYVVLNDTPTGDYYIIGYICGFIATPEPITGNNTICQGDMGVAYSIDTIANATGYTWTIPLGATIITGQNTNAITVDYSDTAVSGMVTVAGINPCGSGPSQQLPVTVNNLPIADAGNDTIIPYGTSTTLHAASGGPGSYSYYWTPAELLVDPYVQDPQTVNLITSSLFTVEVTNDSTSCQNTDNVLVTITGGQLTVNPMAVPGDICTGGYSQLYSNAGGGSNNYTYLWTSIPPDNPPWSSTQANPMVSPDSSRIYQLEVNDGFNITYGQTDLVVYELPTALISGGDTLCGDTASTILTVDLTGMPPWSIIYSNGLSTWQVSDIYTTPHLISVSDSGTYEILEVEDALCVGTPYGYAIVHKYAIPQTPIIAQVGDELFSDIVTGNQWYLDDIAIQGATHTTYMAAVSGKYYDIIINNNCVSDTSNVIDVVIIDINEHSTGVFQIIPNPAKGNIRIKSKYNFSGNLKIKLYSISGVLINEYNLDISNNTTTNTLDISTLDSGLYFLRISNNQINVVNKLIIK